MQSSIFTMQLGGAPIASTLGFAPRSVLVNNYTSGFVRLGDAGQDIPPFVYGAVVALPPGTRNANASLVPTVPAVVGPPVPRKEASLTWLDVELPPSPGQLMPTNALAQGVRINLTTPIVATAAAGATTIVVADARNFVIADPVFIDRQAGGGTFAGFIINAIAANADGTWTLTLASGLPAGGVTAGDIIVLAPTVQISFNDTVTVAPAPGQAPLHLASIESSGAIVYQLLSGVAGQTVKVWGWVLSVEVVGVNSFARIRDDSLAAGAANGTVAVMPAGGTNNQVLSGNHGGAPITTGAGLKVDAAAAGATVRALVAYSQT